MTTLTTAPATTTATTWIEPSLEELEHFTDIWGTWKQRKQAANQLRRYNLRDRWDDYTQGGSSKVVGSAMGTAKKARGLNAATFFADSTGRDVFLHYYLHENSKHGVQSTEFAEGFRNHLSAKGIQVELHILRRWIGQKLADNVWDGQFRELQAFTALAADPHFNPPTHPTAYQDECQGIDILRWSPELLIEEAYQVKAPSWIMKAGGQKDSNLLRKLIRSHNAWRNNQADRYTYIIVPLAESTSIPTHTLTALRYILKANKCSHVIESINIGGVDYYVINTTQTI